MLWPGCHSNRSFPQSCCKPAHHFVIPARGGRARNPCFPLLATHRSDPSTPAGESGAAEPSGDEIEPILAPKHLIADEDHRHAEDAARHGFISDGVQFIASLSRFGLLEHRVRGDSGLCRELAEYLPVRNVLIALPIGTKHRL